MGSCDGDIQEARMVFPFIVRGIAMTSREDVYFVITKERQYQNDRHERLQVKHPHRDEDHSIADWLIYIESQLNDAKKCVYDLRFDEAMHHVRKLTALGVACMEYQGAPRRGRP